MVITPGPGVLACVSRALASGFNKAVFVVLGIVVGDMFFLIMAIYGLSAIAEVLGGVFMVVKYCGAAYLIWLGYRTWTSKVDAHTPRPGEANSRKSCFLSGLTITLGNPKAIVFYLSVLPVFLDLRNLTHSDVLITVSIVILTLGTVLFSYSYAADLVRNFLRSEGALRTVRRCSGTVMISAGVAIVIRD